MEKHSLIIPVGSNWSFKHFFCALELHLSLERPLLGLWSEWHWWRDQSLPFSLVCLCSHQCVYNCICVLALFLASSIMLSRQWEIRFGIQSLTRLYNIELVHTQISLQSRILTPTLKDYQEDCIQMCTPSFPFPDCLLSTVYFCWFVLLLMSQICGLIRSDDF